MIYLERNFLFVVFGVVFIHAAILFFFTFYSSPLTIAKPQDKMIVRTVSLHKIPVKTSKIPEAQVAKVLEKKKTPAIDPSPLEKMPPPKKETPQKKAPVKAVKPPPPKVQKKEVKKEAPLSEREKILQRAKENIAKLQQTSDKFRSNSSVDTLALEDLSVIDSLSIDDADVSSFDSGYYGALASRLRQALRLPEFGDVLLRLTIDSQGNVLSYEARSTESDYNRKYVEAIIKKLQFPPFGKFFQGESKRTFSITLTNDR